MKIKKNDKVVIISGKDKGRKGKVLSCQLKRGKIVVEGLNLGKKHLRPKRAGEKGQKIEIAMPLSVSNVALICPNCSRGIKVGYLLDNKKKYRVCKKCKVKL